MAAEPGCCSATRATARAPPSAGWPPPACRSSPTTWWCARTARCSPGRAASTCGPSPRGSMNAGRDLGVVGTRERWRIDVPPCPAELSPARLDLPRVGVCDRGGAARPDRADVAPGAPPRSSGSLGRPRRRCWTSRPGPHSSGAARKGGARSSTSIARLFSPQDRRRVGDRGVRRPRPSRCAWGHSISEGACQWQRTTRTLRLREQGLNWREIDGEVVVLDVERSHYLNLNATGAVLWLMLAAGTTEPQLVAQADFRSSTSTSPLLVAMSRRSSRAAGTNRLLANDEDQQRLYRGHEPLRPPADTDRPASATPFPPMALRGQDDPVVLVAVRVLLSCLLMDERQLLKRTDTCK